MLASSYEKRTTELRTVWDLSIKLFDEALVQCMHRDPEDAKKHLQYVSISPYLSYYE